LFLMSEGSQSTHPARRSSQIVARKETKAGRQRCPHPPVPPPRQSPLGGLPSQRSPAPFWSGTTSGSTGPPPHSYSLTSSSLAPPPRSPSFSPSPPSRWPS